MTPVEIANQIRKDAHGQILEEPENLVFSCAPGDTAAHEVWAQLRQRPPRSIRSASVRERGTDIDFDPLVGVAADKIIQVNLIKQTEADSCHFFFFPESGPAVEAMSMARTVRIATLGRTQSFRTHRTRYVEWTDDPVGSTTQDVEIELPDPRRLSRDLTPGRQAVVADIGRWLLKDADLRRRDNPFSTWCALAARPLLAAVSSEVTIDETTGELAYAFPGPPKLILSIADSSLTALAVDLQEAADWIYVKNDKDAEVRHGLFASDWARTFQASDVAGAARRALESARSSYSAHLTSSTRETLKALGELRKTVFEETQKVSQRTLDLVGGLWKDLAIAAAPFVTKAVLDSSGINNKAISIGLAAGGALFLLFSFVVQTYINTRFFAYQDDSRRAWLDVAKANMTPEEFDKISTRPVAGSKRVYWWVTGAVGLFYSILIAILVEQAVTIASGTGWISPLFQWIGAKFQ